MPDVRHVALAAVAFAAVACSSGESRSEMEVRVRSEVYVESFGGDVDALIGLCSVDLDDPVDFDTLVDEMTPDVLEAMTFACLPVAERVAAELPS